MKGIQSNGFLPIIAQAIAEMEETHGEFSSRCCSSVRQKRINIIELCDICS